MVGVVGDVGGGVGGEIGVVGGGGVGGGGGAIRGGGVGGGGGGAIRTSKPPPRTNP